MRRPTKLLCMACIVMTVVGMVAYNTARYKRRPFFANSFEMVGPVGIWESGCSVGLNDGRVVSYDIPDRVLLVVAVTPNRNVEWVVHGFPPMERVRLRVRRREDGLLKEIEWRRDCIIYMDRTDSRRIRSI